ncbi:hypothetical protein BKA62DRAFT_625709 [Auriculariales sp. MPI-PUGE-AT-0066]|nr:hypothetical protein BKA62DRAFT_625709 [Auriculariales sp. MPI-PUGE-AT-0066]
MASTCHRCDKMETKACGSCRAVRYCSTACQRSDWTEHKFTCKPDSITCSDRLVRAVTRDEAPHDHVETLIAFKFHKVHLDNDTRTLVAFYKYLVTKLSISAKILETWLNDMDLLAGIEAAVLGYKSQAEEHVRWVCWFVHGKERIWQKVSSYEDPSSGGSGPLDVVGFLMANGMIPISDFPPENHSDYCSLELYRYMLSECTPDLTSVLWVAFGFVAGERADAERLKYAYTMLIHRCAFEEFVNAFRTGHLYDLLEHYKTAQHLHRDVQCILQDGPIDVRTVWHLKHYVTVLHKRVVRSESPLGVAFDEESMARYGFDDITADTQDWIKLADIYYRFFWNKDANPLELELAMRESRIGDYLLHRPFMRLDEEEQDLLLRVTLRLAANRVEHDRTDNFGYNQS